MVQVVLGEERGTTIWQIVCSAPRRGKSVSLVSYVEWEQNSTTDPFRHKFNGRPERMAPLSSPTHFIFRQEQLSNYPTKHSHGHTVLWRMNRSQTLPAQQYSRACPSFELEGLLILYSEIDCPVVVKLNGQLCGWTVLIIRNEDGYPRWRWLCWLVTMG